jgi:hypothetical protein
MYTGKRPTFKQVFSEAMHLSLRDKRRLQEELAKMTSTHLVQPKHDASAFQAAQKLAEEVRRLTQAATADQSLDDAMQQLRGRSWS